MNDRELYGPCCEPCDTCAGEIIRGERMATCAAVASCLREQAEHYKKHERPEIAEALDDAADVVAAWPTPDSMRPVEPEGDE